MHGTLAIVGAGRVGRALGRRLPELGWRIGAVVTRNVASARKAVRFIGAGSPQAGMSRRILASTVILIATPDAAVAEVATELARIGAEELQGKIVLHTSGALDSGVLDPIRKCGAAIASMHPLQTFTGVGVPPLDGKVFAIEGDLMAVRTARKIARALGGTPVQIAARDKPLYHAAGALAAGHALVVVEAATQLLMSLGMKRGQAIGALVPMTRQVLQNYERLGPRAAWTGPLARKDYAVVAAHVDALQKYSLEHREAYEALNRLAERVLVRDSSASNKATTAEKHPADKKSDDKKTAAKATGGKG
jgi:predicted short-subunit dehydrogenase-like oxidoreductase (DUF2520 family)